MSSTLFPHIVFGPVHSRRLGVSLGVNLLPAHGKWCSFDCIYCECGWNADGVADTLLPTKQDVARALEHKLSELADRNLLPDVITFSGNGEPTLHPDFKSIIESTLVLRDRYAPNAQVCVLSNATQIGRPDVFEALLKVDKRILKIDSAFAQTVQKMDQPAQGYDLDRTIQELERFHGDFALQTLFVRGCYNDAEIDNTTPVEIDAWLELIRKLKPKEVMVYAIDRATPAKELVKVPLAELEAIAERVRSLQMNINVNVAG
ncbi:MAG: radical SAM protein [Bacteroidales bacterium]|nr:radical SAM protein [Bacteroidales bacterium]